MSTDWFLFSPSRKKRAMVGSIGMGGVKVWPNDYQGGEFLAWVIEENITDVVLVHEDDQRMDDEAITDFWGEGRAASAPKAGNGEGA